MGQQEHHSSSEERAGGVPLPDELAAESIAHAHEREHSEGDRADDSLEAAALPTEHRPATSAEQLETDTTQTAATLSESETVTGERSPFVAKLESLASERRAALDALNEGMEGLSRAKQGERLASSARVLEEHFHKVADELEKRIETISKVTLPSHEQIKNGTFIPSVLREEKYNDEVSKGIQELLLIANEISRGPSEQGKKIFGRLIGIFDDRPNVNKFLSLCWSTVGAAAGVGLIVATHPHVKHALHAATDLIPPGITHDVAVFTGHVLEVIGWLAIGATGFAFGAMAGGAVRNGIAAAWRRVSGKAMEKSNSARKSATGLRTAIRKASDQCRERLDALEETVEKKFFNRDEQVKKIASDHLIELKDQIINSDDPREQERLVGEYDVTREKHLSLGLSEEMDRDAIKQLGKAFTKLERDEFRPPHLIPAEETKPQKHKGIVAMMGRAMRSGIGKRVRSSNIGLTEAIQATDDIRDFINRQSFPIPEARVPSGVRKTLRGKLCDIKLPLKINIRVPLPDWSEKKIFGIPNPVRPFTIKADLSRILSARYWTHKVVKTYNEVRGHSEAAIKDGAGEITQLTKLFMDSGRSPVKVIVDALIGVPKLLNFGKDIKDGDNFADAVGFALATKEWSRGEVGKAIGKGAVRIPILILKKPFLPILMAAEEGIQKLPSIDKLRKKLYTSGDSLSYLGYGCSEMASTFVQSLFGGIGKHVIERSFKNSSFKELRETGEVGNSTWGLRGWYRFREHIARRWVPGLKIEAYEKENPDGRYLKDKPTSEVYEATLKAVEKAIASHDPDDQKRAKLLLRYADKRLLLEWLEDQQQQIDYRVSLAKKSPALLDLHQAVEKEEDEFAKNSESGEGDGGKSNFVSRTYRAFTRLPYSWHRVTGGKLGGRPTFENRQQRTDECLEQCQKEQIRGQAKQIDVLAWVPNRGGFLAYSDTLGLKFMSPDELTDRILHSENEDRRVGFAPGAQDARLEVVESLLHVDLEGYQRGVLLSMSAPLQRQKRGNLEQQVDRLLEAHFTEKQLFGNGNFPGLFKLGLIAGGQATDAQVNTIRERYERAAKARTS